MYEKDGIMEFIWYIWIDLIWSMIDHSSEDATEDTDSYISSENSF
jgi:hypothetical protein